MRDDGLTLLTDCVNYCIVEIELWFKNNPNNPQNNPNHNLEEMFVIKLFF